MKKAILLTAFVGVIITSNAQVGAVSGNEHTVAPSHRTACDTLFSFDVLAEWASGIAWDGSHFWSGGLDIEFGDFAYSETIYRYTPAGEIVDSIPAPSPTLGVSGLTFDGTYLWGLVEEENRLVSMNINTGQIVTNDVYPELGWNGWDLAFDGTNLWIAGYSPQILLKIDHATGDILEQLYPTAPVFTIECVGDFIYAASGFGEELYTLSPETGETLDTQPWCIPYHTGMCWDGAHMWNISSRIDLGGHQIAYGVPLVGVTNVESAAAMSAQSVFPNPTADVVTVQLDERFSEAVDVQIWSSEGKLVQSSANVSLTGKEKLELNLSHLQQGIFTLVITCQGVSVRENVVIVR